ncbi:unnamed protein product, partial [Chrysoparadoxa australica]
LPCAALIDTLGVGGLQLCYRVYSMESDDPLDKQDFNAVEYLNHHFPTERSLDRLDPFMLKITAQISELDGDISQAVQGQSSAGDQASRDVAEAKAAIADLFGKITDIKKKAGQSEDMVQEICRDIRQLDNAKRHLQTTITALKRLHMLVTAVDQLKGVAQAKQYREAANLLDAVKQLLTHFKSYAEVPRIVELQNVVARVKTDLTAQIYAAFNAVGQLAASTADPESFERHTDIPGQFRSLHEACLVVDALGYQAREKQIKTFCAQQMQRYPALFPADTEQASLEQVERRFAWFRRLLRSIDTRFEGVFPSHWRVQHRLCMLFLQQTRAGLSERLSTGGGEVEDVQSLLTALQKCLAFEREASQRFEDGDVKEAMLDDEGSLVDPESVEGIKRKYQGGGLTSDGVMSEAPKSELAALSKDGRGAEDEGEVEPILPISGMLSSVFDPFMDPYITLERRNMDKLTSKPGGKCAVEDIDADGKLPVFRKSVAVFVYIKGSTERCIKLSTGQTFFKLFKEYQSCLKAYSASLAAMLPSASASVTGPQYKLGEGGERTVCYVANTAEYCAETLPQLEEMVKGKVHLSYRDCIDLNSEQELFYDVIAGAMKALASGLETNLEPALRAMSSMNWGTCESVGEESSYVRTINAAMTPYIPTVRSLLSPTYFRNFCDKFATSFLPSFLSLLLRQRRINEMGTQQLLLDVYNIKSLMLKLPLLGLSSDAAADAAAPASYTKYVNKQMAKIEMVLKLVGTPDDLLGERFRIMWPEGTAHDLHAIMNLKGMKKASQQALEEALGLEVAPA